MKRKYILVISILILAILFGTAATCNMCGLSITPTASTETLAGSETSAETSLETIAEITKDTTESSVSASATETSKETTSKETASATNQTEIPTIKLQIYEGPTAATGDVCYYRIEAIVTGSPTPSVTFSKDDSSGAFGSKKVQVNLTKSSPNYTLTAKAKNSAGEATATLNLTWGCGPTNNPPKIDTISLISNGPVVTNTMYDVTAYAKDPDGDSLSYEWFVSSGGGVLKGSESNPVKWATPSIAGTYNIGVKVLDGKGGEDTKSMNVNVEQTTKTAVFEPSDWGTISQYGVNLNKVILGDDWTNTDLEGVFAFDISSIKGKEITDAKLLLKNANFTPDPCNFKGPIVLSYADFLPGITKEDYNGYQQVALLMFAWDEDPIELTYNVQQFKNYITDRISSGEKLQFFIGFKYSAVGGKTDIAEFRFYESKSDITLTIQYK